MIFLFVCLFCFGVFCLFWFWFWFVCFFLSLFLWGFVVFVVGGFGFFFWGGGVGGGGLFVFINVSFLLRFGRRGAALEKKPVLGQFLAVAACNGPSSVSSSGADSVPREVCFPSFTPTSVQLE